MALLWRMERGGGEQGEDKLMSWRALRAWGDRKKNKKKKEVEKKVSMLVSKTKRLPISWLWSNRSREGGASSIAWVRTSRLNPSVQTSSILQTCRLCGRVPKKCALRVVQAFNSSRPQAASRGLSAGSHSGCRLCQNLLRYLPTIWTWDRKLQKQNKTKKHAGHKK